MTGRWILAALDILQAQSENATLEWIADALDALAFRLENAEIEFKVFVEAPRTLPDEEELDKYIAYMERKYGNA